MANKPIFLLFVIFCIATLCSAQVTFDGQCKNLSAVENFDVQRYLGVWYEIEKYPAVFESGGKCIYAIYSDNRNGTIEVKNTRIITSTNQYSEIIGSARLANPEGKQGKLLVRFPTVPGMREAPYWVMKTDYISFSVVWSCTPIGNSNIQFLWYLSRTRNPDDAERKSVHDFMERLPVDTSHLTTTDQTTCPNLYSIV